MIAALHIAAWIGLAISAVSLALVIPKIWSADTALERFLYLLFTPFQSVGLWVLFLALTKGIAS